jgi:hypothetical protein
VCVDWLSVSKETTDKKTAIAADANNFLPRCLSEHFPKTPNSTASAALIQLIKSCIPGNQPVTFFTSRISTVNLV